MKSYSRLLRLTLLLAVGVAAVEGVLLFKLHRENEELRVSNEKTPKATKPELADKLAKREAELQVLRVQVQDLLRLRHEVRQLRANTNELSRLLEESRQSKPTSTNASPAPTTTAATGDEEDYISKDHWTFAGYATPEATLQSSMWALREGDLEAFLDSLTLDGRAKIEEQMQTGNKSPIELAADLKKSSDALTGFKILDQGTPSHDSIVLQVQMSTTGSAVHRFIFTRVGNEWKMSDEKGQ
ncbi:MAG: hypothetical protein JWR69_1785 [Pedosphaera sp.]|nr:hypothetical protein [Pedosphaera sp.]